MGVVMWSAYFPSTPTIRVRIPLKPTVFSVKCVFETNENKQKRPVLAQKEIYLYLLKKKFYNIDLHRGSFDAKKTAFKTDKLATRVQEKTKEKHREMIKAY